jgi:dihydropteroate synthase
MTYGPALDYPVPAFLMDPSTLIAGVGREKNGPNDAKFRSNQMIIRIGTLELDAPAVMGILNVTPDSFSDGGLFLNVDAAIRQAELMVADGATIIDIGGESTRPGADAVTEQQELDRVIPVIEKVTASQDILVSIDTSQPGVMRAAVAAGAAMINDIRALRQEGALQAAVELQKPVCLMHMCGEPGTMQREPEYRDVVAEVTQFLTERMAQCLAAGLAEELIILDPGFGFGKTTDHNLTLLAELQQLVDIGRPLLVGLSRKSSLRSVTGRDADELLPASISAAVIAVMHGAQIVRVHDVAASIDALKMIRAITELEGEK